VIGQTDVSSLCQLWRKLFWGHHVTRCSPLRHLVNGRNLKSHVVPFFILSSRLQSYCLYPIFLSPPPPFHQTPSHKLVHYFILLLFLPYSCHSFCCHWVRKCVVRENFLFPNGRKRRNKKNRGTNHSRTIEPPTTRGEPGGKRETADLQCVIKRQFDCRLRRLEPDTFVS